MLVYNTPIKYWGYAVLYACYMLNRTPNTNTNISAYQALTNTIPDLSNAVPFYAPGVYHLTLIKCLLVNKPIKPIPK